MCFGIPQAIALFKIFYYIRNTSAKDKNRSQSNLYTIEITNGKYL